MVILTCNHQMFYLFQVQCPKRYKFVFKSFYYVIKLSSMQLLLIYLNKIESKIVTNWIMKLKFKHDTLLVE